MCKSCPYHAGIVNQKIFLTGTDLLPSLFTLYLKFSLPSLDVSSALSLLFSWNKIFLRFACHVWIILRLFFCKSQNHAVGCLFACCILGKPENVNCLRWTGRITVNLSNMMWTYVLLFFCIS